MGVAYYHNVINTAISSGIIPVVTLNHWDLPQALESRRGWMNQETRERFVDFARFCFEEFGSQVSWPVNVSILLI